MECRVGPATQPSFVTSGHLNIPYSFGRVLEPLSQEGNSGAQTGPVMLMMLALGGYRALKMRYKPPKNVLNTRCGQCLWL